DLGGMIETYSACRASAGHPRHSRGRRKQIFTADEKGEKLTDRRSELAPATALELQREPAGGLGEDDEAARPAESGEVGAERTGMGVLVLRRAAALAPRGPQHAHVVRARCAELVACLGPACDATNRRNHLGESAHAGTVAA